MWDRFQRYLYTIFIIKRKYWALAFLCLFVSPAQGEEFFSLQLDSKPFSQTLCHHTHQRTKIKIKVARHRDLHIHRIPGQHIPEDSLKARTKDYSYFVTLEDLSNGALNHGAIAFDIDRAVIFTQARPRGISRTSFLKTLHPTKQLIAVRTLNTFLRLRPIMNAAIDSCRPYPPTVTYDTDDEIDRIEAGRLKFYTMIKGYNENPTSQRPLFIHETGMSDGFFDPDAGQQARVSYHALNPLNFYVPPGHRLELDE